MVTTHMSNNRKISCQSSVCRVHIPAIFIRFVDSIEYNVNGKYVLVDKKLGKSHLLRHEGKEREIQTSEISFILTVYCSNSLFSMIESLFVVLTTMIDKISLSLRSKHVENGRNLISSSLFA